MHFVKFFGLVVEYIFELFFMLLTSALYFSEFPLFCYYFFKDFVGLQFVFCSNGGDSAVLQFLKVDFAFPGVFDHVIMFHLLFKKGFEL